MQSITGGVMLKVGGVGETLPSVKSWDDIIISRYCDNNIAVICAGQYDFHTNGAIGKLHKYR